MFIGKGGLQIEIGKCDGLFVFFYIWRKDFGYLYL